MKRNKKITSVHRQHRSTLPVSVDQIVLIYTTQLYLRVAFVPVNSEKFCWFTRAVIPRLSQQCILFLGTLTTEDKFFFLQEENFGEELYTRKGRIAIQRVTFNKILVMEELKLTQNVHTESLSADVSENEWIELKTLRTILP
ncbi:hypothetical protein MJT46_005441 [Ovis ammon polii x Ovis aries]|nr:hypothetical protein MJT46_005441 [Ovis ammon polii x Ovis aries]